LYKDYINGSVNPKFILFSINAIGSLHILGFFHQSFNTKRNGFRNGALTQYLALTTFHAKDSVFRVSPKQYTQDRLLIRSEGLHQTESGMKFLVAGLGSIGSNIVFFLNSFNNPEFRLIDYDELEIENIKRHFLGFNSIGKMKTKALQEYLRFNEPSQVISTRENSLICICNDEPDYVNNVDYIFLVTGKTNIDRWAAEAIENGIIKKPAFVIWVEPYLLGGHCVYINPHSKPYSNYFDDEGFFLHNVISKSTYQSGNEKLILNEAGCQSSYMPYSSLNVMCFLSSIFPIISNIITNKSKKTMAISWIGDLSISKKLNIEISKNYMNSQNNSLIIHE
jgi:hypothetical protein